MRWALALLVLTAASCGGSAWIFSATPRATVPVSGAPSPSARFSQAGAPTPPLPAGACTRAGMTNAELIRRWLELAGRGDPAAVRDCFAASYGVSDIIVARWATLGFPSKTTQLHLNEVSNGCDRFTVTAEFPNGNPYAPVQDATAMFFVVGVGLDGDKPRIFGTATAAVRRSPDVTPHAGPPDCR